MSNKDSWDPVQYEKFKKQRSQPFFDLIEMVLPAEKPRVVDLGCGTGELTLDLHKHLNAIETIGVDASGEMLKKAQAFASDSLRFTQGNIETWRDFEKFDVIFSNAAIQWCGDHPGIFKRLKDNLRPNGQLAIQMPMNHDYATHVLARQMSQEKPWVGLLREPYAKQEAMLKLEDYASLLFALGFREQNVMLKVYGHELESRDGVIEWVKGTLLTYFQSRLSEDDFEKFMSEFRKRLFEQLPDTKPFFYPFKRALIWARL